MNGFMRLVVILSLVMCLAGCIISPLRPVEHPEIPFARPGYSILAPAGDDWAFYSNNSQVRYELNFFKKIPDPDFHSLAVGVIETPNAAQFESPQEFETWMKKTIEMAMNPNRLRLLDKRIELDKNNKFGPYTIKYFTKSEDHRAVNQGNEPFLLLVDYGYTFVHPSISNLIVQISYSERGRPQEIRPETEREAELFFSGIKLEQNKGKSFRLGVVKIKGASSGGFFGLPDPDVEYIKKKTLDNIPISEICSILSSKYSITIDANVDKTYKTVKEGMDSGGFFSTENAYYGNLEYEKNTGSIGAMLGGSHITNSRAFPDVVNVTYSVEHGLIKESYRYGINIRSSGQEIANMSGIVASVATPGDQAAIWNSYADNARHIGEALKRDLLETVAK